MAIPVVLIPGLVCDQAVWEHQAKALAELTTVSIANHQELDSLPAMATKVLNEAPPKFAVAGHSMGGRVAMEVFRQAPERVAGMALMDTASHPLPPGEAGEKEKAGRFRLLEIARSDGMRSMSVDWVQGMVYPPRLTDAALIESIVAMQARHSADIFAAQIRALLARPDAGELLNGIRVPTLVLTGQQDSWSPPQRHRDMAAAIPGSELVLVDECGHMSSMEQPAAVTNALLSWLARIG